MVKSPNSLNKLARNGQTLSRSIASRPSAVLRASASWPSGMQQGYPSPGGAGGAGAVVAALFGAGDRGACDASLLRGSMGGSASGGSNASFGALPLSLGLGLAHSTTSPVSSPARGTGGGGGFGRSPSLSPPSSPGAPAKPSSASSASNYMFNAFNDASNFAYNATAGLRAAAGAPFATTAGASIPEAPATPPRKARAGPAASPGAAGLPGAPPSSQAALTPSASAFSTEAPPPGSPERHTAERRLITQLLRQFKQTAEVRQYLKYYGSVGDDARFAIVKISGDVLSSPSETARVAASLAFLHRIGLVPIVVHGAGLFTGRQSAEVAAAAAGVPDGVSPETRRRTIMAAAQGYMRDANARLVAALAAEGVAAASLADGVFQAASDTDSFLLGGHNAGGGGASIAGAAGRITTVDVSAIASSVAGGRIPIVAALGSVAGTGYPAPGCLTFSTTEATVALSRAVRPLKVIWLRPEGGITLPSPPAGGDAASSAPKPLRSLDLTAHAPALAAKIEAAAAQTAAAAATACDAASESTRLALPDGLADRFGGVLVDAGDIAQIASSTGASLADAGALAQLGALHAVLGARPGCTVSVTSPEGLAAELFTHKGEGTQVVKGERILSLASLDGVDVPRLTALLEGAFGAKLPEGYLTGLASSGRLRRLYLSESYRGCAVVTTEGVDSGPGGALGGVGYLDKFAVDPSAQGDKLGEVLWRSMVAEEPRLFWRSRAANRVNPWYYEQASGCFKSGDWTVFWRGLDAGQALPAIATALALPPTFPLKTASTGAPTATGAGAGPDADAEGPASPASQPLLK